MIVSITAGYLTVIYRHYELKIVVFYRVILYTIIEKKMPVFDDMEMQEREQRQRMQERGEQNGGAGHGTVETSFTDLNNEPLTNPDHNEDRTDVETEEAPTNYPKNPNPVWAERVDSNDGNTVTLITRDGNDVEVSSVEFVSSDSADYNDVDGDTFSLALKQTEETSRRLANLRGDNAEITKNKLERIKRINSKIRKLYGKRLGND